MTSPRSLDVVALGEPLVEFVECDHPDVGRHYRMGFGGDTSNAAIAAARQGARVGYVTAVGNDIFGDELIALWKREGVDASRIKRSPAPTGVYFVQPQPSGHRFTYLRAQSAASRFGPADLDAGYLAGTRILHVSAISQAISPSMRAAVAEAARNARAAGGLVSFDTNLRLKLWSLDDARSGLAEALAWTDILFPSDDEAQQMTGLEDVDAIVDHFLGLGPRIVVLKRGGAGALVATREARRHIAPLPVEAVDSTGAGDAFAGAFLAAFCRHGDAFEAGTFAARVAAGTVAGLGAIDPIPCLRDTDPA